jgi:hypothetical protein
LPHDFGDVSAIVDFWAAFPDIPVECPPAGEPGPCGGAVETFFNDLLFPRYDAMPLPAELN